MDFCGNCHIVESTSEVITDDSQGLSLIGVFGRPIASFGDFDYSEALRRAGGVWDAEMLYSFSVNAKLTIPGTRMQWNDGWNADDALHIVAYFATFAE